MTRRWLIVCVAVLACFISGVCLTTALTHRPETAKISQAGPTVVIRVPLIDWNSSTERTHPTLYAMARKGAVGALLTRELSGHSCTFDGWLTLSAGTRTGVGRPVPEVPPGGTPHPCPRIQSPLRTDATSGYYPDWRTWRDKTLSRSPKGDIGRLAATAQQAGSCVTAVGGGAGLAAADRTGTVRSYLPGVAQANFSTCPITLVSLTSDSDQSLAEVVRKIPANATVIVAALGDDAAREHVRAVVVSGPGVPHGRLTSRNIRQVGLLGTVDLSALLLHRFGSLAPRLPEARVPSVQTDDSTYGPVRDVQQLGRELDVQHAVLRSFFPSILIAAFLVLIAGLAIWRWQVVRAQRTGDGQLSRRTERVLRWSVALTAGAIAAVPVATFLIGVLPWYRTPHARTALMLGILLLSLGTSAVALAGPWRRHGSGPIVLILAVTGFTVLDDTMHGSRLQLTSMMGLQPLYGGRYYGMGNVGYAMLATSALLVAALLAGPLVRAGRRDLAAVTVVLVAVPTVLVDAYPGWGADGGGPIAMIPAFAYLALNAAGLRVTWQRAALIGGVTVALVGGLAVLDYLRPAQDRTHLGDFVASVRQHGQAGGLGKIGEINGRMLLTNPLLFVVPLLLIAVIVILVAPSRRYTRPLSRLWEKVPLLGTGLVALVICWTLGFFANDSGVGIPPVGMLIAVPLLVMMAAAPGVHRPAAVTDPPAPAA